MSIAQQTTNITNDSRSGFFALTVPVFLISLLALIPVNYFFPDGQIHDFVFTGVLVLSAFFCLILVGLMMKPVATLGRINGAMAAVIVIGIFYLLLRTPKPVELLSFRMNETLMVLILFCVFTLILSSSEISSQDKYVRLIILLVAGIVTFEALLGIFQWSGVVRYRNEFFRLGGTFSNPNIFGSFLAIGGIFLFPFLLYPSTSVSRDLLHLIYAVSLIVATGLFLSVSRSCWISVTVAASAILAFRFLKGKRMGKGILILMVAVAVAILFAIKFLLFNYNESKSASTSGRLFIYKTILAASAEKPLFGYGFGSFGREYNVYQAAYFESHPDSPYAVNADNINTAPSAVLQILFELGWTGLFLYIILFFTVFRLGYKSLLSCRPDEVPPQIGCLGVLAVVFILSFFSYPFYIIENNILILLTLSVMKLNYIYKPMKGINKVATIFFRSILLVILAFFLWASISQYQYKLQWAALRKTGPDMKLSDRIQRYEQLYLHLSGSYLFLIEYGMLSFEQENYRKAIRLFRESNREFASYQTYLYIGTAHQMLKEYDQAESAFLLASNMVPNRIVPKYDLFKLYTETGDKRRALDKAILISKLSVKVESSITSYIKREIDLFLEKYKNPI